MTKKTYRLEMEIEVFDEKKLLKVATEHMRDCTEDRTYVVEHVEDALTSLLDPGGGGAAYDGDLNEAGIQIVETTTQIISDGFAIEPMSARKGVRSSLWLKSTTPRTTVGSRTTRPTRTAIASARHTTPTAGQGAPGATGPTSRRLTTTAAMTTPRPRADIKVEERA
jgi:hypothetical protein